MARNRRAVLEALASISDGTAPDWAAVDSGESPDTARGMVALRAIAGVAELHRSFGGDSAPGFAAPACWNGFTIRELVGQGSSGAVYRAWEPTLDREVALKLFKPSGPQAAARVRMLAEGQALARIRDEHVVRVYGAAEADGFVGLWMELVRGRTLQDLVATQGTMTPHEAALVVQVICRALTEVHRAGLVHGDVKAQNAIRENGGRVVLMDFGSGVVRDRHHPAWRTGTPLYMAPEILDGGAPTVAGDIYAAGVLLFFLVTGQYPVTGGSIADLQDAHRSGRRRYLQELRPDCPDAFAEVVDRALAADPVTRFRSAVDLQRALVQVLSVPRSHRPIFRIVQLLIVATAITASGITLAYRGTWGTSVGRSYSSVAVIPFDGSDGTVETNQFADRMSDDITMQLSRLPDLRLIARTSASLYRHTSTPATQIGRELNVAAVVTGRVLIRQSAISVLVELVDTRSSEELWADTFEGATEELDALQARVALGIARALKGQLTQHQSAAIARQPMDSAALRLYQLGRYFLEKRTPLDLHTSVNYFKEALAIQPDAGLIYAGLADAYLFSGLYDAMPPSEALPLSEAAAAEALKRDDTLAEAHAALASVYHEQWRFAEADIAYQRAISLNPNHAPAHHWYATYLLEMGRFGEARREIDYALSLDPFSSAIAAARGVVLYQSRDFNAAIEQFTKVLAANPAFPQAALALAEAYTAVGRFADALSTLERLRGSNIDGRVRGLAAYIYASSGDREKAVGLLHDARAEVEGKRNGEVDLAAAYEILGFEDDSRAALERAFRHHDDSLVFALVEPRWDRLRSTPAFARLLAAMKFPTGDAR